jgi:hypothetical protein
MQLTRQMTPDDVHHAFVVEAEQTWGAERMPELAEGLAAIAQQAYLLLQSPLQALDAEPDTPGWSPRREAEADGDRP